MPTLEKNEQFHTKVSIPLKDLEKSNDLFKKIKNIGPEIPNSGSMGEPFGRCAEGTCPL